MSNKTKEDVRIEIRSACVMAGGTTDYTKLEVHISDGDYVSLIDPNDAQEVVIGNVADGSAVKMLDAIRDVLSMNR